MTDANLLELIQTDPAKGFDILVSQYSALVFRICAASMVPLGTKEDAEECASDVFVSFYRHINEIDLEKGSVKGYLAVAAKRAAISVVRKLKKESGKVSLESVQFEVEDVDRSSLREQKKLIYEAIKKLGEPDCEIITRRFLFGETVKEISVRLKMRPDAVQKRAKRAQAKLKILLGGAFHEEQ